MLIANPILRATRDAASRPNCAAARIPDHVSGSQRGSSPSLRLRCPRRALGGLPTNRGGASPTRLQLDKLVISQLGLLAQRRLARGVKLNHSEATVSAIRKRGLPSSSFFVVFFSIMAVYLASCPLIRLRGSNTTTSADYDMTTPHRLSSPTTSMSSSAMETTAWPT